MVCNCNESRIELVVKQGASQTFNLTIRDKDTNPVDLTGYEVQVQIKKYPLAKVDSLYEFRLSNIPSDNGYITSIAEGKISIIITSDITSNLPPSIYYLIIMLVSPSNQIIISGEGDRSGILKICKQ